MKLTEIWNAAGAWQALALLKKNPKLVYRLLKYEKAVNVELDVCNTKREAILYEVAGVQPPEPVTLAQNSSQYVEFMNRFNESLDVESDLPWIGLSMEELIDALDIEKSNVISEQELVLLEPFFTEPAKLGIVPAEPEPVAEEALAN